MPDDRIAALGAIIAPSLRDSAGRHEYDGHVPDLSRGGVDAALRRIGGRQPANGPEHAPDDAHDDAHLAAFEARVQVEFGEVEAHRRSPRPLLEALDLSGYDRPYAPQEERDAARRDHLAAWPDAIEAGIDALDRMPAPVARGLQAPVTGAARGIGGIVGATEALAAHARLVSHVDHIATHGDPDPAIGAGALAQLLGVGEAATVDLGRMEEDADRERDRLVELLEDGTGRLDAGRLGTGRLDAGRLGTGRLGTGRPPHEVVEELLTDHPDAAGVLSEAETLTAETIAFTRDRGLLTDDDGTCEVAPSPPSRRWATAMMSWAAPYEEDGTSWYFITPPDDGWEPKRQREWLSAFSRTTLPSTTVHEVAPGHFSHGRALRRITSDIRRSLHSPAFVEGWAHYAEELLVEEGFRDGGPSFQVGVALKALLRVTRMAVAIGLHRGTMTFDDGVDRFRRDALVRDAVATAETARATFDPTYGRYTWGKLEILDLRSRARRAWGAGFTLRRFHDALLSLGAPPLGLMDAALDTPVSR